MHVFLSFLKEKEAKPYYCIWNFVFFFLEGNLEVGKNIK